MNYGELKQAVQDYTDNAETSFVTNIPLFIRIAEERILKNVQLSLFRKNAAANTSSSNKYLACPSDFLAPFSLSLAGTDGDKVFLDFKDPSYIQTYTPDGSTLGTPRYYAQYDVDTFILAPTPDGVYSAELHYFYRPQSITVLTDSQSSWLSENAEIALLYGTLVEACVYMKGEPDIMATYNQKFQEALVGVKMLGEAKETTDEYRTGKVIREKN